jgi:hypothetical protein
MSTATLVVSFLAGGVVGLLYMAFSATQRERRCRRRGHKTRQRVDRGYCLPPPGWGSTRAVAVSFHEVVTTCARCHEELIPRRRVHEESIHAITLPDDAMRRMRDTGFYTSGGPVI